MNQDKKRLRQEKILNGNLTKTIFSIALPLIVYNYFTFLYTFFDTLMVAHKGFTNVGAVVYLDQIKSMFVALSSTLAGGGCIIVARYLGAKEFDKAKKCANNLIYLALLTSALLLLIVIPSAKQILILTNTPNELIEVGLTYFMIQITTVGVTFYNGCYIGLEKSKGSTQNILILNIGVMIIKLLLSSIFVYILGGGIVSVAVATLIAQLCLSVFATIIMRNKNNILRLEKTKLEAYYIKRIVRIFFPMFLGNFSFAFGKVIVNSMASPVYGSLAIGAIGVTNQLIALGYGVMSGIEESEPAIVSQNIGNNNLPRAVKAFRLTLLINSIFGISFLVIISLLQEPLIKLFIDEGNLEQLQVIKDIFFFQRTDLISCTVAASCMGFIYGLGLTKLSLVLNFSRLFVFRIPLLWYLINYTNVGHQALGMVYSFSNIGFAILSVILVLIIYFKYKHNKLRLNEL